MMPSAQLTSVKAAQSTEVKVHGLTIHTRQSYLSTITGLLKKNFVEYAPRDGSVGQLVYRDFEDCGKTIEYECFTECNTIAIYRSNMAKEIAELKKINSNGEFSSKLKNYVPVERSSVSVSSIDIERKTIENGIQSPTTTPSLSTSSNLQKRLSGYGDLLTQTTNGNSLTLSGRSSSPARTVIKSERLSPVPDDEQMETLTMETLTSSSLSEFSPTPIRIKEKLGSLTQSNSGYLHTSSESLGGRQVKPEPPLSNNEIAASHEHSSASSDLFFFKPRRPPRNVSPANTIIKEEKTESTSNELFTMQTQPPRNVSPTGTIIKDELGGLDQADPMFDYNGSANCLYQTGSITDSRLLSSELFEMIDRPPRNVSATGTILEEEPDEFLNSESVLTAAGTVSRIIKREPVSPQESMSPQEPITPHEPIIAQEPITPQEPIIHQEPEEETESSSNEVFAMQTQPPRSVSPTGTILKDELGSLDQADPMFDYNKVDNSLYQTGSITDSRLLSSELFEMVVRPPRNVSATGTILEEKPDEFLNSESVLTDPCTLSRIIKTEPMSPQQSMSPEEPTTAQEPITPHEPIIAQEPITPQEPIIHQEPEEETESSSNELFAMQIQPPRSVSPTGTIIKDELDGLDQADPMFDYNEAANCLYQTGSITGSRFLNSELFEMIVRPPRNVSATETILKEEHDEFLNSESVLTAAGTQEPITVEEPITRQESITHQESIIHQEPVTYEEPITVEEPITPQEPITHQESIIHQEPVTYEEPITAQESITHHEPVAHQEPITPQEPMRPKEPIRPQKPMSLQDAMIQQEPNRTEEPHPTSHTTLQNSEERNNLIGTYSCVPTFSMQTDSPRNVSPTDAIIKSKSLKLQSLSSVSFISASSISSNCKARTESPMYTVVKEKRTSLELANNPFRSRSPSPEHRVKSERSSSRSSRKRHRSRSMEKPIIKHERSHKHGSDHDTRQESSSSKKQLHKSRDRSSKSSRESKKRRSSRSREHDLFDQDRRLSIKSESKSKYDRERCSGKRTKTERNPNDCETEIETEIEEDVTTEIEESMNSTVDGYQSPLASTSKAKKDNLADRWSLQLSPLPESSPTRSTSEEKNFEDSDYGWKYPAPPKPKPQAEPDSLYDNPVMKEKLQNFAKDLKTEYDLDVIRKSSELLIEAIKESVKMELPNKLTELDKQIQKKKDDYIRKLFGTDNFDNWDDNPALSNVNVTQKLKPYKSFMATDVPLMDKINMNSVMNAMRLTPVRERNELVFHGQIKKIKTDFQGQELPTRLLNAIKEEKAVIVKLIKKWLMPYYKNGRIQPKYLFNVVARKICHVFYDRFADENIIKTYIDDLFKKVGTITNPSDLEM